jgi:hypothetical protein
VSEQPSVARRSVLDGVEAAARLAEFGLRVEHFARAQVRGDELRARCLPVHPRTYPGQVMWAETTAALRTELLALDRGWQVGSASNYETVFNPGLGMAISVLGGDAFTGVRGHQAPKAAHRRGPVTSGRISRNFQDQYVLPLEGIDLPAATDDDCLTWFFLINARAETLYSELSLASDVGVDRRIGRWAERILLPGLPMPGAVTPIQPGDDDDEPPAVHVDRR